MTQPQGETQPVASFLSQVEIGASQSHESLTLWPLLRRDQPQRTKPQRVYVPLRKAMAAGTVRVDEVGWMGAVSSVRIKNKGAVPVLFLFGEEIRGAKQNRVANASFLVGPKSKSVLDVSCVEAGRWSVAPRARFEGSDEILAPSLRRRMSTRVALARARGKRFRADQSEVWDEIHERLALANAPSATSAYADYATSRSETLESFLKHFHALPGQVGFVACSGSEVVGLEAIGRPDVFRESFAALVRAYALDALDEHLLRSTGRSRSSGRAHDDPRSFLSALASSRFQRGASLALGDDLRFEGSGIGGCALVDEELVHITAFPEP